ncbi:MAG: RidA family protein [Thermoguttaceae bacterium]|nr:RidA family protein [Thermoguttaceae bacterium]MDW8038577.1 RidA family protein [Thermoguttaceae bacterium]
MSAEKRLQELGLLLPPAPEAKGLYRPVVIVGQWAFTSGHLSMDAEGRLLTGRLGADINIEAGQQAARWAGLNLLASLRQALGSLDQVRRVVKLTGFIQSTPDFQQHPAVLNGCSQLLADLFGTEAGIGVRSAIGASSLPLGAAVEVEALVEILP